MSCSGSRPSLPTYSSPENTDFHPVFKYALESVLVSTGNTHLQIRAQYPSPTGPIDLVLFNTRTNKVVLPIEIKRTQSSVRGGGRRQARDYWSNLGAQNETNFYCVSNLELTELFRFDPHRPKTSAQQVKLTDPIAGRLDVAANAASFYESLQRCLTEVLALVLGVAQHQYVLGWPEFQSTIESVMHDVDAWHRMFVPVCFEYIRGAARHSENLRGLTSAWRAADFYRPSPDRLLRLGRKVDFEHVFKEPAPLDNDNIGFSPASLVEAHAGGKELGLGDDIAELVSEILDKQPGVVETDPELAQLLAVVARAALGRDLLPTEYVLDPGSGSGRLLTALSRVAFPALAPAQLKANEIEPLFAEALSLRLGLAFASVISPVNAPAVSISGVETLSKAYFDSVRLVVMNPPYISGVASAGIKPRFVQRIRELTGAEPLLGTGQAALELLFLELVWHLAAPGTVVAVVFPYQHLCRRSAPVLALRQFLLRQFGLSHIVLYPHTGLFQGVIKQTALLVGVKEGNATSEHVQVIEVQKPVADLDMQALLRGLAASSPAPTHGVSVRRLERNSLLSSVDKGWGSALSDTQAELFVSKHMHGYLRLAGLGKNVRRGTLGNSGNVKLTVLDTDPARNPPFFRSIPAPWLRPVLNNTKGMPRMLTARSVQEQALLPPDEAYTDGSNENKILRKVIDEYLVWLPPSRGTQLKAVKDTDTVLKDLQRNQKQVGSGLVLVQRASRTQGQIALLEEEGFMLSSNVLMVRLPTAQQRELMASWLLSVFGQLQLELQAAPQEGMRKLEVGSLKRVLYPDFESIPSEKVKLLRACAQTDEAISFKSPVRRPLDTIWAQVVAPDAADQCLETAFDLFERLVDGRRGLGDR